MCFRGLDAEKWTTGARATLRALMETDRPPYAEVLLTRLEHALHVRLCDYCACFLKERSHRSEPGRVLRGRKHGMQLTVEHLLSGGTHPGPSRPHLLRCVALLKREDHPFRTIACGRLGECVRAREATHGEDALAFWLMGGRPAIFDDARLAKRVRRWMSDAASAPPWWSELPSACRHCGGEEETNGEPTSYMCALLFVCPPTQKGLDAAVALIEDADDDPPSSVVRRLMCPRCRRRSVVSYAYHSALWPQLGLTPMSCRDAYYGHLVGLCRPHPCKKKRARDEEEEDATPTPS
jgi:hypothetical protein